MKKIKIEVELTCNNTDKVDILENFHDFIGKSDYPSVKMKTIVFDCVSFEEDIEVKNES